MAEILVTLVIAGLLTTITLTTFSRRWEVERLQVATKSLVSWLSERRSQAMASMESSDEGACSIAIDQSNAFLSQPDAVEIANNVTIQTYNTICPDTQQSQALDLRSVSNAPALLVNSSTDMIVFTFRGTTTTEAEIKLGFPDNPSWRCIKVMKPLGIIRMGYTNSSDGTCDYRKPYSLS